MASEITQNKYFLQIALVDEEIHFNIDASWILLAPTHLAMKQMGRSGEIMIVKVFR
jgi:hypothetical protein